jgi:hypothetical protein
MEEAHRRFGHASTERLRHLEENTAGLTLNTKTREFCDTCAFAKSNVKPFPKERTKPIRAFEIITSDLKGPLLEASESGFATSSRSTVLTPPGVQLDSYKTRQVNKSYK